MQAEQEVLAPCDGISCSCRRIIVIFSSCCQTKEALFFIGSASLLHLQKKIRLSGNASVMMNVERRAQGPDLSTPFPKRNTCYLGE